MRQIEGDKRWNCLLVKIDYKLKKHEGLKLSDRNWLCAACGTLHDRDLNAALNIRAQGILKLKAEGLSVSAHGGCVSPVPIAPAAACEVGRLRLQA